MSQQLFNYLYTALAHLKLEQKEISNIKRLVLEFQKLSSTITQEEPIMYMGYKIFHNTSYWPGVWEYVHKDYDGDEDNRLGTGETIEDCIEMIWNRET